MGKYATHPFTFNLLTPFLSHNRRGSRGLRVTGSLACRVVSDARTGLVVVAALDLQVPHLAANVARLLTVRARSHSVGGGAARVALRGLRA